MIEHKCDRCKEKVSWREGVFVNVTGSGVTDITRHYYSNKRRRLCILNRLTTVLPYVVITRF